VDWAWPRLKSWRTDIGVFEAPTVRAEVCGQRRDQSEFGNALGAMMFEFLSWNERPRWIGGRHRADDSAEARDYDLERPDAGATPRKVGRRRLLPPLLRI